MATMTIARTGDDDGGAGRMQGMRKRRMWEDEMKRRARDRTTRRREDRDEGEGG